MSPLSAARSKNSRPIRQSGPQERQECLSIHFQCHTGQASCKGRTLSSAGRRVCAHLLMASTTSIPLITSPKMV
eukprot:5608385-Pleurochrysis_carterae.AAC.1